MKSSRWSSRARTAFLITALGGAVAFAVYPLHSLPGQQAEPAEVSSQESQPTFRLRVERNVVVVRVVVRDGHGRPIANLHKEDFQVFDNGKPQAISQFTLESPESVAAAHPPAPSDNLAEETSGEAPAPSFRYVAVYFDDVHISREDLDRTRNAAVRFITKDVQPSDRFALFTSSGQNQIDFTDDRSKVTDMLQRLWPRPLVPPDPDACPDISDYQAHLIVNQNDAEAIAEAKQEVFDCECRNLPDQALQECVKRTEDTALSSAIRVLNRSEFESGYVMRTLEAVVRRMSALPGQRNVLVVSPGFLAVNLNYQLDTIVDRALRAGVTINTLDARGLYAGTPLGDASKRAMVTPERPDLVTFKTTFEIDRLSRDADPLRDVAEDTGGIFFNNSNDLDEGFQKTGGLPEASYVLVYSPSNLKSDGRFHTIKVKLLNLPRLNVQARKGYFAPHKATDLAEQAKSDVEDAVFSQEQVNELPSEFHIQFFRTGESDARLSVLTHIDLQSLRFRKDEGRNLNNLTVVIALFDAGGKFLEAKQKTLQLRLLDKSLERLVSNGVTMKTSFDVKPGTYLVRQVVREGEGAQISGLSRTVEIPF